MEDKMEDVVEGADEERAEGEREEIPAASGETTEEDAAVAIEEAAAPAEEPVAPAAAPVAVEEPERAKPPKREKPAAGKINITKKYALLGAAGALALCVLLAGGYGVWRAVSAPKAPIKDVTKLSPVDVSALYSQRNTRKNDMPAGLDVLLGTPQDSRVVLIGSGSGAVDAYGKDKETYKNMFMDQEWLLTDSETHAQLSEELATDIIREMQIKALLKLALTQNCERVCYSVEYVDLPEGSDIAAYVAANGGGSAVQGRDSYTFVFHSIWASQAIGRDIKTVAATRADFNAFVKELESFEAVESLIIPGAGR